MPVMHDPKTTEMSPDNPDYPQKPLQCPRCESMDTKFCYYNNYSTAQPRHFCKNCKRYWTAGGSLRNVPVGGGMRKNKKAKLSKPGHDLLSSSPSSSSSLLGDSSNHSFLSPNGAALANTGLGQYFDNSQQAFGGAGATHSPSSDRPVDESSMAYYNYPAMSGFGYSESPAESHNASDYVSAAASLYMNPIAAQFNYFDARRASQASKYGGAYSMQQQQLAALGSDEQQPPQDFGYFYHPPAFRGFDQAQSNSGEVSEVVSERSQASSDALKDPTMHQKLSQRSMLNQQMQNQSNGIAWHPSSQNSQVQDNSPSSTTNEVGQDGQCRDRAWAEDDDEELGNVVNVNPKDWEQVSEVLFGGTADFFCLPGF